MGELSKTETAEAENAHIATRTTTEMAAIDASGRVVFELFSFDYFTYFGHVYKC